MDLAVLRRRHVGSPSALFCWIAISLLCVTSRSSANPLDQEFGRAESRIFSAPFLLSPGQGLLATALPERLDQLDYSRVRGHRPERPGEYFWGTERVWIFRHSHWSRGSWHPERLLQIELASGGERLTALLDENGDDLPTDQRYLEPLRLSESLSPARSRRRPVVLDQLPDHVWQAVVAAEDGRFFDHGGVDSRSVARAILANLKRGGVAQGGSTITQQLIKIRDLTPKQSLGRKISEALRALALEAEVDKRDILENYLNSVYFGHVSGIEIYGLGSAARAYFSKNADQLNVAESALLAGVIQSPNRLSPIRHPQQALERRRYVLSRLVEEGWLDQATADRVGDRETPELHVEAPSPEMAGSLLAAIRQAAGVPLERRESDGRGVVIETTLDPYLQGLAESSLRGSTGRGLQGSLVAGNARTGEILAYVAGDPRLPLDGLDRARRSPRQPGSTVKPFVMLEALDSCGGEAALTLSTLVRDRELTIDLSSGPWQPRNSDRRYRGVVDVRDTLTESLNVPTVRVARHCGFDAVAKRFERVGLGAVNPDQPAFVLGAVEVSPRELLVAYSRLASPRRVRPPEMLIDRLLTPSGDVLRQFRSRGSLRPGTPRPSDRFLVRDALEDAARAAGIDIDGAWGKTGTSSERRDAWFAGGLGDLVAVVWIGRDDAAGSRVSGASSAAPAWEQWMAAARPLALTAQALEDDDDAHSDLIEKIVDDETGLVLEEARPGSRREWFRRGTVPAKRRWWRPGAIAPIIE